MRWRRRSRRAAVPPSRLDPRDLFAEAAAGVLQRPARSALTMLGTLLGVGAFVAVLGITATASSQISDRFNALTATEVQVVDAGQQDPSLFPDPFPADADARVRSLNGVVGGGVYWPVPLDGRTVRTAPVGPDAAGVALPVLAASPGVFTAAVPTMLSGRTYDGFHDSRAERVAVLGAGVARRLGITSVADRPAVFIGSIPFTIIGIIAEVQRMPDLLLSVVVPRGAAPALDARPAPDQRPQMLIATRMGAARQVAAEAPVALRPDAPELLRAVPPPDPRTLRQAVSGDLGSLFLALAGICLVIGTVGIANTTLVAVMERTEEIGLRRALGAGGSHVASQFLAESAALGTLGGLFGTASGVLVVVAVAAIQDWTATIAPLTVLLAPLAGATTGLLAGLYPAYRASRIEPATALRR